MSNGVLRTGDFDLLHRLLDPSALADELRFDTAAPASVTERTALAARCYSTVGVTAGIGLLVAGADHFEIYLDVETGIVLRATSIMNGGIVAETEFTAIQLGHALPSSTFEPDWPPNAPVTPFEQIPR